METNTIEQRMARIEREFDQLKQQVLDLKPSAKDWRSTVGVMPDDELSRSPVLRWGLHTPPSQQKPFPTVKVRGGIITSVQVAEALHDE